MMNHLRKHAVMIVVAVVIVAAGYMAYQRHQSNQVENVAIQGIPGYNGGGVQQKPGQGHHNSRNSSNNQGRYGE